MEKNEKKKQVRKKRERKEGENYKAENGGKLEMKERGNRVEREREIKREKAKN